MQDEKTKQNDESSPSERLVWEKPDVSDLEITQITKGINGGGASDGTLYS